MVPGFKLQELYSLFLKLILVFKVAVERSFTLQKAVSPNGQLKIKLATIIELRNGKNGFRNHTAANNEK